MICRSGDALPGAAGDEAELGFGDEDTTRTKAQPVTQSCRPTMSSPPRAGSSRDTGPMTKPQPTTRTRWWRFFLAALAAVLASLLGATTASDAIITAAQTRVGAMTVTVQASVGVHQSITPGQRWVHASPQAGIVSATGVAANAAPKLGWGVGEDIYSLTKAGNTPAWSTVRA